MAKTPDKKPKQTLRQAAAQQDKPKKRRLRAPVGSVTRLLGRVKSTAAKPLSKIGRIIVPKYFRNSWRELKEVTWPNARQTTKLTFAVVVFATIFGALIAIVDYGLDKLFRTLLT